MYTQKCRARTPSWSGFWMQLFKKTSNVSFGFTWGWLVHRAHVTIFIGGLWTPLSKKDSWVRAVALAVAVVSWARHGLFLQAPITVLFLKNIETRTLCAYGDEDATRWARSVTGTSSHPAFWASVTAPQLRLYRGYEKNKGESSFCLHTITEVSKFLSNNNTAQLQKKKRRQVRLSKYTWKDVFLSLQMQVVLIQDYWNPEQNEWDDRKFH